MTFQQIERVEQGERFSPDSIGAQCELFMIEMNATQDDLFGDDYDVPSFADVMSGACR